jgi:hypothetical protein
MNDIVDDTGLNVLQLFVQNFKQADLTLTGTVRKATLVNQSTKAVNPVASIPLAHRRASTTTIANGSSIPVRGSVSHIKVDEPLTEATPLVSSETERTCVTCGIDISPKWWPCPPAALSGLLNGDHHHVDESPLVRGAVAEGGSGHVALAAAALHQNGQGPTPVPSNFQCHKCHWKKIQKEPTPTPATLPQREESRPSIPPATVNVPAADTDLAPTVPQYAWPQPPHYQSNGPYNNWSRQSPAPQAVAPVHQLNGNQSPHISAGAVPQGSGQSQFRQPPQPVQSVPPIQPLARSPHQNGQIAQNPNGYSQSPHRSISSTSHHIQNGPYSSFASTQPTAQHLTNGGPPPRALEHPFSQSNAQPHPRPPFALPPQGSPPVQREPNIQGRDLGSQQNGTRPNEGRVNGGASASPSLRNLLS